MEAPTASWALPCVICPSGIRCLIRNVWQHLRISAPKNINHDVIDDCFTNFCSVNAKSDSDYIAVWNGMEVSLVKRGNVGFCTIGGRQQTAISAGALNAYVKIPSEFSAAMFQRVRLVDQDGTPFIVDITTDGQFCLYYILGSGGPTNWMGSFAYPLKS